VVFELVHVLIGQIEAFACQIRLLWAVTQCNNRSNTRKGY